MPVERLTLCPSEGLAPFRSTAPHSVTGFHTSNRYSQATFAARVGKGWGTGGAGDVWWVPPALRGLGACPGWHCLTPVAFAAPLKTNKQFEGEIMLLAEAARSPARGRFFS